MLLGEHEHTLDDKNRLTLPAKLREGLGEELVVTRGLDKCLCVYSREGFELLAARVGALDGFSPEARMMQRFFFTGGEQVRPDRQGRIVIPLRLLEEAKAGRELVIAGVYDRLEIWDRAAWREQRTKAEGSAEDVAERLADRS